MNYRLLNWKEKLHESLKSMGLGFSGSQIDWIDNFIESLLSTLPQEEKKECLNPTCPKCGYALQTDDLKQVCKLIMTSPSPLDSIEEIEEIKTLDVSYYLSDLIIKQTLNSLIKNQTKIINYLKGKK